MSKFIAVTVVYEGDSTIRRLVNVSLILYIDPSESEGAIITMATATGDPKEEYFYVAETPDEVLALIEGRLLEEPSDDAGAVKVKL